MKPIFLHSQFRAGSTYFWNKFRLTGRYHCYYEPFNEVLEGSLHSLDPHCGKGFAQHMRHPEVSVDYFDEYARDENGLVPLYNKEFAYGRQPDNKQADDELRAYLDSLLAHAECSGRRPVFGFCRSRYLQDWMKQHYDSDNFFLLREARSQWESYLSFENNYFPANNLLMVAKNKACSTLQPLQDIIYLPEYSNGSVLTEVEFYRRTVEPLLGLEREYFVFYYLWLTSFLEGLQHCRLIFDVDALSRSAELRRNCETRLSEMGIDLDFSDCRSPQYSETHLTSEQMQEIESDVELLVSASFPEKIAAIAEAANAAQNILLPSHLQLLQQLQSLSDSTRAQSQAETLCALPQKDFFSRDEFRTGALESLFQYSQEAATLRHQNRQYSQWVAEPLTKKLLHRLRFLYHHKIGASGTHLSHLH